MRYLDWLGFIAGTVFLLVCLFMAIRARKSLEDTKKESGGLSFDDYKTLAGTPPTSEACESEVVQESAKHPVPLEYYYNAYLTGLLMRDPYATSLLNVLLSEETNPQKYLKTVLTVLKVQQDDLSPGGQYHYTMSKLIKDVQEFEKTWTTLDHARLSLLLFNYQSEINAGNFYCGLRTTEWPGVIVNNERIRRLRAGGQTIFLSTEQMEAVCARTSN
jgi:hypothetical protein